MSLCPIQKVVIYTGHRTTKVLGPYAENIRKRVEMFEKLNAYREIKGRNLWEVVQTSGEQLMKALQNPRNTLLVIPAGQSTHLDQAFSAEQLNGLQHDFFQQGGRGYLNCGSAYWASRIRVYNDVCTEQPTSRKKIVKESLIPLFKGIASGPICQYFAPTYKVGFFSDAVTVASENRTCTVLLSGGGSFHLPENDTSTQVLARYLHTDLIRCGKSPEECNQSDIAAVLVRVQKGAAILSMFHPYYGSQDLDAERYEQAFPGCGTNWKRIVANLSSEDTRMNFVLEKFLFPLEDCPVSES